MINKSISRLYRVWVRAGELTHLTLAGRCHVTRADPQLTAAIKADPGESVLSYYPTLAEITLAAMAPRSKMVAIHPIHGYAIKPQQDLKTIKRNERERNRVETVNRGFETLRRHVPSAATVKKMSKVNILTEAVDYIMQLKQMLDQPSGGLSLEPQQMSAWTQYHHQPQYHHQHSPHHYHQQMTQLTPSSYQDTSSQGYYSDTSLQSPALSRSHSWTSPVVTQASWTSPQSFHNVHIKTELPDSTTDNVDSSGDEEDVLDAIAEWQRV